MHAQLSTTCTRLSTTCTRLCVLSALYTLAVRLCFPTPMFRFCQAGDYRAVVSYHLANFRCASLSAFVLYNIMHTQWNGYQWEGALENHSAWLLCTPPYNDYTPKLMNGSHSYCPCKTPSLDQFNATGLCFMNSEVYTISI